MRGHRDTLSELPDEILVKILSSLPTKDVVATSFLSKRWRFLWTLVPRLSYDFSHYNNYYLSFIRFVYRSLLLHKSPVLESLQFKILRRCAIEVDLGIWIKTAVERSVRELSISLYKEPLRLPKCLFTCTTLVVLKLQNLSLLDLCSYDCFKMLKTLHLVYVKYSNEQSLPLLLSNCLFLEDLVLQRCPGDNVKVVTIAMPYLRSLSIRRNFLTSDYRGEDNNDGDDGFLISAPSLKRFNLEDHWGAFCFIEDMPKIDEANVDVNYGNTDKVMASLTSVKRLSLCLMTADAAYLSGTNFSQLVKLEICPCALQWCDLLSRVVHDSPNLQFLKLFQRHGDRPKIKETCWKQPVCVPNCFVSHLETFEWKAYEGTKMQKEVAVYVLRHAICLKKAIFSAKFTIGVHERYEMIKELATLPRGSTTCQLFFD